jgi:GH18 family chitinase
VGTGTRQLPRPSAATHIDHNAFVARETSVRHNLIFAFALTLAEACGVLVAHVRADAPASSFRIVGYLPDYRTASLDPNVGKFVTDLVYFSAIPEASGELNRKRLNPEHIRSLRKIKDAHHVALILCVGGWDRSKGFAPLAAAPRARERFVSALLTFCRENDFDGVDLDWEHPANDAEARDYGTLLAALKAAFAPHKLSVSIAAAGWQTLTPEAISAVDRIHLMAYDTEGRHATLPFAESDVQRLVKQGVPPSKICLGVPFYGRGISDRSKTLTYREIVQKYHPAPEIDEVDGVYFNGPETTARKTRFAIDSKLGGIMIWELGQDAPGDVSLLRAINRTVPNRAGP